MSDYNFNLWPLILVPVLCVLALWGAWELIDWLLISDTIRSQTPILPEIELVIENNVVDTIYIYRQK